MRILFLAWFHRDKNPDDIAHLTDEELVELLELDPKADLRAPGWWEHLCTLDSPDELDDVIALVRACKERDDLDALKYILSRHAHYVSLSHTHT